mmetsp:Transcript_29857/g.66974  ORF Transcript_29857/g.66974 Transcript_29857/m.66974 type:complete len:108 (+) Transcript_29857:435-758(+)
MRLDIAFPLHIRSVFVYRTLLVDLHRSSHTGQEVFNMDFSGFGLIELFENGQSGLLGKPVILRPFEKLLKIECPTPIHIKRPKLCCCRFLFFFGLTLKIKYAFQFQI